MHLHMPRRKPEVRMDANELSRRWLPLLLGIALAVRLAAAFGLQWALDERLHRRFLIQGDAEGYWHLAGDIAAGNEYAIYDPPRRVLRMPGYPLLLSIPRVFFGDRLLPARILMAFVGTLACWGVYLLGKELFDAKVGLLAATLAALSPTMVLFTPVILSETAFACAMVFGLVAAARLVRRHRDGADGAGSGFWAALTGLGFAAACYIRPSWLLAGPLLWGGLIAFSASRRRAAWDGLVLNCILLAALVPWGIRNHQAVGHFVLTTLWVGPSLYDGLNPRATGDSEMSFFDRDNLMSRMSEYEVNRHYRNAALEFVRDHPGRTLQLALLKLWRYCKPWPNAEQFSGPLAAMAVSIVYVPALALAAYAACKRPDPWILTLTLGPILYFAAIHAVFVSSLRYRLPAEYPLYVLSAAGLKLLLDRLRAARQARGPA
jgi:4-amino-4-deoxy-L-arabinose transferase-like glycosyltransferase